MYFCVYFEKFPWNILPLALGIADCPLFSLLTLRSSSDFDAHCCSDENPSIRRIWSLTRELIRNVLFAWHLCCLKTPWNAIFCHKETTVMYSAVNTHIVIPQWKDINGSNKKKSNSMRVHLLIFPYLQKIVNQCTLRHTFFLTHFL